MENIETKIEDLRKEFNSKLDEILKAEIVKPKTIDEIAREFSIFQINYPDNSTYKDFKDFCIENKQDIINALNNL